MSELSDIKAEIGTITRKMSVTSTEAQTNVSAMATHLTSLTDALTRMAPFLSQFDALEAERLRLVNELANRDVVISDLEIEIAELEAQLLTLTASNTALTAANARLTADAAVSTLRIATLEAEIVTLRAEITRLLARIAELEAGEPPIIVDPPVPPTPGAPDFSTYAFAHLIPTWRQHTKPTEADCDWVIDGITRVATSRKGLGTVVLNPSTGVAGDLYKRSINAGHGPRITFGIKGYVGPAWVGGFYDSSGGSALGDICRRAQDGTWLDQDVQFVGLTPDAEVLLTWGGPFGYTRRVAGMATGIVGSPNTHAVICNKRAGEIVLDDFWILPPVGTTVGWHAMLHLSNWTRLVLKDLKRKGRNGAAPERTSGHIPYLKHSDVVGSETWVLNCDLSGANQTGMQKRPGKDEDYLTAAGRDTVIIANNKINSYGWDHTNFGGGSAITHWSSPSARVFIVGNEVLDARGGCLMVGGQPLYTGSAAGVNVVNFDRNWYDAQGYPIGEVYVDGNRFENPRGDRSAVSLSNAKRVYWGDKNTVVGRMSIWSQFIAERMPAMPRGNVTFVGDRTKVPTNILSYDPATRTERALTAAQITAMHTPAWPVMV